MRKKKEYIDTYPQREDSRRQSGLTPKGTAAKGSPVVLYVGLALTVAAFLLVFVPLVLFLVPGGVASASTPLITVCIYLNALGVALSFAGIVMTANSALCNKGIARLSFFFGTLAFLFGLALLIVCLLFGEFIPLPYL